MLKMIHAWMPRTVSLRILSAVAPINPTTPAVTPSRKACADWLFTNFSRKTCPITVKAKRELEIDNEFEKDKVGIGYEPIELLFHFY